MKHVLLSVAIFAAGPAVVASATFVHDPRHAANRPQVGQGEIATPIFERALPNVPGKSLLAVEVVYPPGTASPPHRHPGSAFIWAYVVSGEIVSAVGNEPPRIYRAGENFYEAPGARHRVSRNASRTKPAKLLAVFVKDSGRGQLVFPDPN